jgi:hypothetical protein
MSLREGKSEAKSVLSNWWVFASSPKNTTQVEQLSTIQLQGFHRRASYCCASDHKQGIFAPGKVVRPPLAAWIEKLNKTSGLRVTGARLDRLVRVAPGA